MARLHFLDGNTAGDAVSASTPPPKATGLKGSEQPISGAEFEGIGLGHAAAEVLQVDEHLGLKDDW